MQENISSRKDVLINRPSHTSWS